MVIKKSIITEIKSIIESHKNGITINLNGEIDIKNKGFYVSITNNTFKEVGLKEVYNLLNKATEYQKENNIKTYLGAWFSDNSLKWYIDLSLWVETKKEALSIARNFNQEAIFNIQKLESVYL